MSEVIGPDGRWTPTSYRKGYKAAAHQLHVHLGLTRAFADSTADPDLFRYLLTLAWRAPAP